MAEIFNRFKNGAQYNTSLASTARFPFSSFRRYRTTSASMISPLLHLFPKILVDIFLVSIPFHSFIPFGLDLVPPKYGTGKAARRND